jgi:hypothetical protein
MKNFFGYTKRFSRYIIFFPEMKTFSGNDIYASFQKCPLCKKYNLNDIFTQETATLLPEKGHLGGLDSPGPPIPTPLVTIYELWRLKGKY